MKECFFDHVLTKKVFYFVNNDRTLFDAMKIHSRTSICVMNQENEIVTIPFVVTRDAYLGSSSRWIYGRVLSSPEDQYYQIEIRLQKDMPETDTVEVFLQAPPVSFKKPVKK